ncbi:MAG: biotin/lipoyl-containing protein, partial [Chloroflexota bacterium]|nr:biotin/lipoyl-containing protein [Chloroflexota bacterium]
MPTNVVMPQLGESVVEGTVSKWLKQPGDSVAAFEPLLEVSTDKVETEIPAPADGVLLSIQVEAGATVAHGTILAVIGAAGELDAPVFQNDTPPTPLSGGRTALASAPLSDEGRTALASAPL